jgi:hypothetical protein
MHFPSAMAGVAWRRAAGMLVILRALSLGRSSDV